MFQVFREFAVVSGHFTLSLRVHGAFIVFHFLELGVELFNLLVSSGGLAVNFFELLILLSHGGMGLEKLLLHLLETGLKLLDIISNNFFF